MIKKKRRLRWLIPAGVIVGLTMAFLIYTGSYYHATEEALEALRSDDAVMVSEMDYGWFFDGPAEDTALVFYPGAKVEETAYAPLLHRLAAEGMDVSLVSMPFHLAFFGKDKAADIIGTRNDYDQWYVGGHSLGGAMAASFAAENGDALEGLVLLAAYPTKPLDNGLTEILLYGAEDRVLNLENVQAGDEYAPEHFTKRVIRGGNHAQFGNYGEQKGDGTATISAAKQQEETVQIIMDGSMR